MNPIAGPQEIMSELTALQALTNHPSWPVYAKYLNDYQKVVMQHLLTAKDDYALTLAAGGVRVLEDVRNWPERHMKLLQQSLSAEPEPQSR